LIKVNTNRADSKIDVLFTKETLDGVSLSFVGVTLLKPE